MKWRKHMQALKTGVAIGGALALAVGLAAVPAQAQKKGGTLNFVVGSKIPSYDGHAESTFGMIHPIRPFYSLLIRVNPENPGRSNRLRLRSVRRRRARADRRWQDLHLQNQAGRQVPRRPAVDRARHRRHASTRSSIRRRGIRSIRKAYFRVVQSIEAPDDTTVVFKLEFPTATFIPVARDAVQLRLLEKGPRRARV